MTCTGRALGRGARGDMQSNDEAWLNGFEVTTLELQLIHTM